MKKVVVNAPAPTEPKAITFVPNFDRLLIKPIPVEGRTVGGIIIPDKFKDKASKGTVIAAGANRNKDLPVLFKVGDIVAYPKTYTGTELFIDGEEYIILHNDNIYGVL
jgi:chaperonin GroES